MTQGTQHSADDPRNAGILIWIFWSFWIGLIITLVGLIFFGGFARGRWY